MTDKIPRIGSKASVWHSHALMTSGGLKKKDLMKTKKGRIVSRRQHTLGLKRIKHLFALGYKPTRGKFVAMKKSMATTKKHKGKRHTRKRGGSNGVPHMPSSTGKAPGSM